MSTANAIIGRALRMIKVAQAGETIEAGIAADSLAVLNSMGQRFLATGILAAWTDAASVASSLVTPASQDEALAANLAVLMAPEFEIGEAPPSVVAMASQGRQDLWRDRLTAGNYSTCNDLILRALRLLFDAGKLPDTVSFPGAFATLNAMLAEWDGAGFGFTDPAYIATSTAITLPEADWEAVAANLSVRLAREYGVDPAAIGAGADALYGRLVARYFKPAY